MRHLRILAALLSVPLACTAESWHCTNDVEIACAGQHCIANESFTPMSLSLAESGEMEICAYSGCWRGGSNLMKSDGILFFSAPALKWSGANPDDAMAIIALDPHDGIALVKVAGFAMPVHCTANDQEHAAPNEKASH